MTPEQALALKAAAFVAAAFAPSLVYLAALRRSERYGREAWPPLLAALLYGAVVSVVWALVLSPVGLWVARAWRPDVDATLLAVVVVAPVVEEAVKAAGVRAFGHRVTRVVDGAVYGGAVALGFAATESLVYALSALATGGVGAWVAVAASRAVSAALLHPAATGVTGLGIGWARARGAPWAVALPFYGVAVLMHGAYNWIAVSAPTVTVLGVEASVRLPAAALLAAAGFAVVRAAVAWGSRRPPRGRGARRA